MKKPHNSAKKNLRFLASFILIILLILTLIIGFNFIDNKYNHSDDINVTLIKSDLKPKNSVLDMIDYHKYDEYLVHEEADNNKSENKIKEVKEEVSEINESLTFIEDNLSENNLSFVSTIEPFVKEVIIESDISITQKEVDAYRTKKPKLVIIIDDVSFSHQIEDIKKLNLDLTMSFLPPNSIHPRTSHLAKNIDDYMVHLPLEALKYPKEEDHTLNIDDSEDKIEARIKQIREWFPNAKYINNHTGSKFTANKQALRKLFKVLEKYNFQFIDSRTTPETKVKFITKEFNLEYIRRDIFLDNKADIEYIKGQLKKAITKAKRKGIAIVIAHPRKTTIKALANSSELLSEVELININKLIL